MIIILLGILCGEGQATSVSEVNYSDAAYTDLYKQAQAGDFQARDAFIQKIDDRHVADNKFLKKTNWGAFLTEPSSAQEARVWLYLLRKNQKNKRNGMGIPTKLSNAITRNKGADQDWNYAYALMVYYTVPSATTINGRIFYGKTPFDQLAKRGYARARIKQGRARCDSLETRAKNGDPKAENLLGVMYYKDQNYAKAMALFQRAAEKGCAYAENSIGVMHENGLGVPQDYDKAMERYLKAHELGNSWATRNIGVLYHYGQGVPQDYAKAMEWFLKAVESGSTDSEEYIKALLGFSSNTEVKDNLANMKNPQWLKNRFIQQGIKFYDRKDYKLAKLYFECYPEDATAYLYTGRMYQYGHGFNKIMSRL